MTSSGRQGSLDSINHTLARVMRLGGSRSMFARQAAAADVDLAQPSYVLLRTLIDEGPPDERNEQIRIRQEHVQRRYRQY